MVDAFYTPPSVANFLLESYFGDSEPISVGDFSAGDGSLLEAARRRWPKIRVVATDIRKSAVGGLVERFGSSSVARCDFSRSQARASTRLLVRHLKKLELVVVNPPFSCKGGSTWDVRIGDDSLKVSRALSFVINSLPYLADKAQLLAILPLSSISSQKDAAAWVAVRKLYSVDVLAEFDRGAFSGVAARTAAVRISSLRAQVEITRQDRDAPKIGTTVVEVIRGSFQMHKVRKLKLLDGVYRLIHTSELKDGKVHLNGKGAKSERSLRGPVVLLPRVGRPTSSKVAVYRGRERIVLSDCVFALRCQSSIEAVSVADTIQKNWMTIERAYGGTCAPYLTTTGLSLALAQLGLTTKGAAGQ